MGSSKAPVPPDNGVQDSAAFIAASARHVSISASGLEKAAQDVTVDVINQICSPKAFDAELHFFDGGPLTVQYLLVVDALNFCFWPDDELEYEQLAGGVKASVLRDPACISAQNLAGITGPGVRALLGWKRELPLQEERARLLREVGTGLLSHFGGQAAGLVEAAGFCAPELVRLVAQHFPGFRDHAVHRGRQVFFYKRAQIFVGDVYGAFQGGGAYGRLSHMERLTMFADYRVPVVLRVMGVLTLSPELAAKLEAHEELAPGSSEEVELRGVSIHAVELLKAALHARFAGGGEGGSSGDASAALQWGLPCSVQLDWWLWETGEKLRHQHPPHHRTLSIYY